MHGHLISLSENLSNLLLYRQESRKHGCQNVSVVFCMTDGASALPRRHIDDPSFPDKPFISLPSQERSSLQENQIPSPSLKGLLGWHHSQMLFSHSVLFWSHIWPLRPVFSLIHTCFCGAKYKCIQEEMQVYTQPIRETHMHHTPVGCMHADLQIC